MQTNEHSIFVEASEIPDPNRRRAFLDQACGADVVLRTRIEALLETPPDEFLNVPAVEQLKSKAATSGTSTVKQPNPGDPAHIGPGNVIFEFTEKPSFNFLNSSSIRKIGKYVIWGVIGEGAFGVVFKAFDENLNRFVAIKVLKPESTATSESRMRFMREGRSVAAIGKHENIVEVFSVHEQPRPYLVMEYIDGQTLQKKLDDEGPMEMPQILQIGIQVATGLAAAHEKDVNHRDIKPSNILLAGQHALIADFGLARAVDDPRLTGSGMIVGTPMYMAPEQAKGMPFDHRADLYSLGSVLYEMASGSPPFEIGKSGNKHAVIMRVSKGNPRPLKDIAPKVPDWFCEIISNLHSTEPDDRLSAPELACLLERCQSDLQQLVRPGTTLSPECMQVVINATARAFRDETPTSNSLLLRYNHWCKMDWVAQWKATQGKSGP